MTPDEIRLQDRVEMRKPHPCGSREWVVTRIGADIKIRCLGCDRVVMLDRADFLRRKRRTLAHGPVAAEISLGLKPPAADEGEANEA